MIPQIPILIDLAAVKRLLEKIRTTVNPIFEAFHLVLNDPTYKIRVSVSGNYLQVEYAQRAATPGQEKWNTAVRGNITTGIPSYVNNAAAIAGGLVAGDFYRTGADPDFIARVN